MMATNSDLTMARKAKNDEFYTQYADIAREMDAYVEYNPNVFCDKTILCPCDDPSHSNFTRYFADNFNRFGLRKVISTSYANGVMGQETHGRIRVMAGDASVNSDVPNIERDGYLDGDGDFCSEEVTALRDEADIIITNPPFSLFREFLAWAMDGSRKLSIIGNVNALKYKSVFPPPSYVTTGYGWDRASTLVTGSSMSQTHTRCVVLRAASTRMAGGSSA